MKHQVVDVERMTRVELIELVDSLQARLESVASDDDNALLNLQHVLGLTPNEARLLSLLHDGRPHRKWWLADQLYADRADDPPELRIIDVYISKLRLKLDRYGLDIETVWGVGYLLNDPHSAYEKAAAGTKPPQVVEIPERRHTQRVERRPYGADQTLMMEYLRDRGRSGPVIESGRELANNSGVRLNVAQVLNALAAKGLIEIVERACQGGGPRLPSVWTLRVVPEASA